MNEISTPSPLRLLVINDSEYIVGNTKYCRRKNGYSGRLCQAQSVGYPSDSDHYTSIYLIPMDSLLQSLVMEVRHLQGRIRRR